MQGLNLIWNLHSLLRDSSPQSEMCEVGCDSLVCGKRTLLILKRNLFIFIHIFGCSALALKLIPELILNYVLYSNPCSVTHSLHDFRQVILPGSVPSPLKSGNTSGQLLYYY